MPVQSVLFARRLWSEPAAEHWLRIHGYTVSPVDAKPNFWRFRQIEPVPGARYFTKKLAHPPGIELVIALHSGGYAHSRTKASEWAPPPAPPEPFEPARLDPKEDPMGLFEVKRETSDVELDDWGKAHIPGFLGVEARSMFDQLYPDGKRMEPGTSCVLNLDRGDYARHGTHWTGVRVSSEAPLVMYFDSFGEPPPREVTLRSRREGLGLLYPDIQYQGADEVNCGPRALAVLHYLSDAAKKGSELEAFAEIGKETRPVEGLVL